jgi:hypothetical protein
MGKRKERAMSDDKKKAEKKRGKKKLAISKETIQELSDEQLDRVAGGVTGGCAAGEDVATITRVRGGTAGETCTCSAPPCA